jgi:hypothetical protein
MAYLGDIIERVNELAEELIEDAKLLSAEQFGLDDRCGNLYMGEDFIAVPLHRDRTLQYYGGFEYVDHSSRQVIGEFVFYSTDDDRVEGAMDKAREEHANVLVAGRA